MAENNQIMEEIRLQNYAEFQNKNKKHFDELYSQYSHIIGIELIIAGPIDKKIESRFGHTLLRFVSDSNDPINDKVLSFSAEIKDLTVSYRKGITGGYTVVAQIGTFGQFINSYVENEERPLSRYVIPTNKKLRYKLIQTLARWIQSPNQMGSYKFLSNNCAGVLLKFLEQSGFPAAFRIPVPSMLPFLLADRYITPYEKVSIPTLAPIFKSLADKLKVPERELRIGHWPLEAISYLKRLPEETLTQLWFKAAPVEPEVRNEFKTIILDKKGLQLNKIYGIKSLPIEMYELCEDKPCADRITAAIEKENIYDGRPNYLKAVSEYYRVKINTSLPWLSDVQKKFVNHSLYLQSN